MPRADALAMTGLNMEKQYKLIICHTVAEELEGTDLVQPGTEVVLMEALLHRDPQKLKNELQDEIDRTEGVEAILLGYGLCSRSTLDITSDKFPLVIPKMQDCIGIFMGSDKVYREQFFGEPGTYYLTRGWIKHGGNPYSVHQQMVEKYGQRMAGILLEKTIKNYTRIAYIETDESSQEEYLEYSKKVAQELKLKFEEIAGSRSVLRKLLAGDWDDDFLVVPPGGTFAMTDF